MLFGFALAEIILLFVCPLLVLIFIWSDAEWTALGVVVLAIAFYIHYLGADTALQAVKTPDLIMAFVKWTSIYAVVGLIFSLIKWKIKTMKAASAFQQFLTSSISNKQIIDGVRSFGLHDSTLIKQNFMSDLDSLPSSELKVAVNEVLEQRPEAKRYFMVGLWNAGYSTNTTRDVLSIIPTADGYTTRYSKWVLTKYVTSWTVYWPWHAALLVLDDLIRTLAEWFVEHFGKLFQRMADSSFSSIK